VIWPSGDFLFASLIGDKPAVALDLGAKDDQYVRIMPFTNGPSVPKMPGELPIIRLLAVQNR
jgi:hypothetical protein